MQKECGEGVSVSHKIHCFCILCQFIWVLFGLWAHTLTIRGIHPKELPQLKAAASEIEPQGLSNSDLPITDPDTVTTAP